MLSKLTSCVVFLSLAVTVPAGATMIDDFTSDLLDPNWVQSTVNDGGAGTFTFDTMTVADQLTVTMSGREALPARDLVECGAGVALVDHRSDALGRESKQADRRLDQLRRAEAFRGVHGEEPACGLS